MDPVSGPVRYRSGTGTRLFFWNYRFRFVPIPVRFRPVVPASVPVPERPGPVVPLPVPLPPIIACNFRPLEFHISKPFPAFEFIHTFHTYFMPKLYLFHDISRHFFTAESCHYNTKIISLLTINCHLLDK